MGVVEELFSIRSASPGCSLAAFGDLGSKLVLRVSAESDWPQERLDDLCLTAADCFERTDRAVSDGRFGGLEGEVADSAIVLGPADIRLFLRGRSDPSDVICCVCHTPDDIPVVQAAARAALRRL